MTSTLAQGVGRSPGESVHPLRALAASPALIILVLGGLALRLTIAYVLFPSSGFETDLATYSSWALTLADHGPSGFYANAGFADYPPAYLYLLWPIGLLARQAADPAAMAVDLLKLPPILLDLVVGYVLYRLVLGWAWPGRRAESLALAAAALYLFNPVAFYDSALWGQSDAAGALVLLLGAAALVRGNSEGAAALAVMAALVKPQFGVVLAPLVAVVLVKRHLLRPGSGPRHDPWGPRRLAAFLAAEQGPLRLLTAAAAGILTFFALALPFGMGPWEYLERMGGTAGGYGYLSVNAFNAWALVGAGGSQPLAQSLSWSDDTIPLLGPVPGVAIGAGLLVAGILWGALRGAARDDRWTLVVSLAFLAIAFFILPTRVHERYVFPAIALLPLLAVVSGRWALALILLSIGAFINLHAILTLPLYGTDNVTDLPLGEWFRSAPLIAVSSLLQTAVGLWAAWQLRPSLRSTPDGFDAAAGEAPSDALVASAAPQPWPSWSGSATGPLVPPVDAGSRAWVRGPSALDWLIHRLSRPSVRADRSRRLFGERGGRIDRVDLVIVTALVLAAILLRGFRLEQPVGMHFDEVYHARTATEFLQDWEYGQPHAIYEFTHPHLAKYAMAWGIRLAGGNELLGSEPLGSPVLDAVVERRWTEAGESGGDRLYVATGSSLRVHDLASRALIGELPVAATALALDDDGHTLYLAGPAGSLYRLETGSLSASQLATGRTVGADDQANPGGPEAFSAGPGAPVEQLLVTDTSLVATTAGSISTFDLATGMPLSERFSFTASDALALPWEERIVVDTRELRDRQQAARRLARALVGGEGGGLGTATSDGALAGASDGVSGMDDLAGHAVDAESRRLADLFAVDGLVVADAFLDAATLERVRSAIDDGDLPGVKVESAPLLAVADHRGISILDAWTLDLIAEVATEQGVTGLALVEDGLDEPTIYASAGDALEIVGLLEAGPGLPDRLSMPGAVRDVAWNEPANLVHVLGDAPEGGPTVYVVEPHGNAVFADVPLPAEPSLLLMDTQPDHPERDRGELLALTTDGSLSRVGIDGNAFGWRLPGMLAGALMAGLLYLLARVLFARRSIAVLAGVLTLAEGMFFVNARIGMNDVYVTAFITLGALLVAPLYVDPRRIWSAVLLLPAAGLVLGLAFASKWVALYAIGGLVLLVLFRSGLGRVIALLGMLGLTAVLGAMAVRPAPVDDPARNWVFLILMLSLTGLLAAAMVRRPLPITRPELRLAIVGPLLVGVVLIIVGLATGEPGDTSTDLLAGRWPVALGALGTVLGLGTAAIAWLAARAGHGPWARGRAEPPVDASVSPWFHPGRWAGLGWLATLCLLTLLPLAVYVVSYAPWIELGNAWGVPLVGQLPFMPEGGAGGGQTLPGLVTSMYQYHDNLRASHAATSPWWAWPLDLKPVWFFSDRYADGATGLIYDTGNLVIFWLGLAAMAFAAVAAWRRRSLSLTVVVILWAALWLPWSRIDRATFQYHVYASLPFLVLALAYFLAELWHGPGVRTWFLARVATAAAIVAVPLLWLLRTPLCILAGTAEAHAGGAACASEVTRTAQLSQGGLAVMVVLALGIAGVVTTAWLGARRSASSPWRRSRAAGAAWPVVIALLTLGGVVAALALLDTTTTTTLTLTSDVLAIIGLVALVPLAALVMRARDPRRLVLGLLGAAALWLVLFYPNLSGLPMPTDLAQLYQGLLPTWNWDFQFAVNNDPAVGGGTLGLDTLVVGIAAALVVVGSAIAARRWVGAPSDDPAPGGPTPSAQPPGRPDWAHPPGGGSGPS